MAPQLDFQTQSPQTLPPHPDDGFLVSGSSPTIHLVGPGKVGRALLRVLPGTRFRLTGLSDSTATIHSADGLDPLGLANLKESGSRVNGLPGAGFVPLRVLLTMDVADFVVDTTATRPDDGEDVLARCLAALSSRSCLVLASKRALLEDPLSLAFHSRGARLGFNAVLGGTGLHFKRELEGLRAGWQSVACVPNATTTAVISTLEQGATHEEALERARCDGLLENDPTHDLDGTDAAIKLVIVASLLSGRKRTLAEVDRSALTDLDPELLAWRYRRGLTTRLVGRIHSGGPERGRPDPGGGLASAEGDLSLGYEEVPRGSCLAVPPGRVAYAYALRDGRTRLHIGAGLGPHGTARALLADIVALSAGKAVTR